MAAMGGKSLDYYLQIAQEDYYTKGGEPPGQWIGRGAAALGLAGRVEGASFRHVFQGFSPDGSLALVQYAGKVSTHEKKGHHPGWDLTFSAPKSVSVLWAVADTATRKTIEKCHLAAVEAAIGYLEDNAAITRRGKDGTTREAVAGLVCATFPHSTSRSQDPNLHTHTLVMNLAQRADGSWGAVVGKPFFEEKMTTGALYRANLAANLERELGFEIEPTKHGFELAGMPKPLLRHFSTRRREIEEELKALGELGPEASARAALVTRDRKAHFSREGLFAKWKMEAANLGFTPDRLRRADRTLPTEPARALQAVENRLERTSEPFSESRFLRCFAEEALKQGLDPAPFCNQAKDHLHGSSFVKTGEGREAHFLTEQGLRSRGGFFRHVAGLDRRSFSPVSESHFAEAVLSLARQGFDLSEEDRALARSATMGTKAVEVLRPQTPRSYAAIETARHAWERRGYAVFGICPTVREAKEMQGLTSMRTWTPTRFLRDLRPKSHAETLRIMRRLETDHGISFSSPWAFLKFAEKVKRTPWVQLQGKDRLFGFIPGKRSVILVDRADSLSLPHLEALAEAARKSGAKLVLLDGRGNSWRRNVLDLLPPKEIALSHGAPVATALSPALSRDASLGRSLIEGQTYPAPDLTPTRGRSLAQDTLDHLEKEKEEERLRDVDWDKDRGRDL